VEHVANEDGKRLPFGEDVGLDQFDSLVEPVVRDLPRCLQL
jgi:hypothetical protein